MGVALAVLSSVLMGTSDFLGGRATRRLGALVVAGWSQVVGLAILVLLLPLTTVPQHWGWVGWSLLAGVSGVIALVALFAALSTGTVGVISAVTALGTAVPLLVGLALGERPSALQSAGLAIGLLGAVAAGGPELRGGSSRAVLLAVLSALTAGAMLVFLRAGAAQEPVLSLVAMRLIRIVGFGALALWARSLGGVRRADVAWLVAIGATDVLGLLSYALATRFGLLSVTGVLGGLFPVTTALLGRFVLSERLRPLQGVGVLLAFAGVGLIAW